MDNGSRGGISVQRGILRILVPFSILHFPFSIFAQSDASAISRAIRAAAERSAPSVVAVEVDRIKEDEPAGGPAMNRIYREFFTRPAGPASGVILETDGWILTSQYNIAGEIRKIMVHLPGRPVPLEAKLVGFDQVRDIALLKVEAKGLPVLPPAPKPPAVAETLIVLGRSPDPDRLTVNAGIVSAAARHEGTALQTDAEMNYGNAGGAAVDLEGRLVGIAAQVHHRAVYGQSSGIGYVTTLAAIRERLDRLKKGEKLLKPKEAWLGIQIAEGAEDVEGIQIQDVVQGSPAETAGLKPRDVIQAVDGEPLALVEELHVFLKRKKPGDVVKLSVKRGEDEVELKLTLGEKP